MNYKTNIWKLYAINFFNGLIPAYVIERLFWQQKDMTIQMVIYTEIIYAVTVIIFEIPTGIIADKWSRKNMMVLSAILSLFEFGILIFAKQFSHFAIAIFLTGIGCAAWSGSENALLFDSLQLTGDKQKFEKHLGLLNVAHLTAAILAALFGSFLASRFGFELNYWISVISIFISLCITLILTEPQIKSDMDEKIAIKKYFTISLQFFKKNPDIRVILFFGMIIGAALNYIDEFWQLYISEFGIPVIYFGLFSVSFTFMRFPGNMFANALKKWFSYRTILLSVLFIFSFGFLYIYLVRDYSCLVVLFLICLFSGIIEPLVTGYLHHRIDSTMRATIDSFQSLGLRIISIITGLGFGYFSTRISIFGGYGFIGLLCSVFFLYFLMASKKITK